MGKIRDFFYLLTIAVLISLSMIFIGAAFREEYPLWKNQKILEDLRSDVKAEETGDEVPGIDWEKLKKINPDIVGWIKVPGTRIDYPVLQGSRWNEYLHKDYKGEYCYAGSIFLQPETSFEDKHLILYGHNMRTRSMFGSLHEFESEDFYKKHETHPELLKNLKELVTFFQDRYDELEILLEFEDEGIQLETRVVANILRQLTINIVSAVEDYDISMILIEGKVTEE